MRRVFQLFATLMLASLVLGGIVMLEINLDKAEVVEGMNGNFLSRLLVEGMQLDIAAPGSFRMAGWLWLALGLASLVGIAAVFVRRRTLGLVVGVGLLVFILVAVAVQPPLAAVTANDPKTTGMGIGFFGAIGTGVLILLHTVLKPKAKPNS